MGTSWMLPSTTVVIWGMTILVPWTTMGCDSLGYENGKRLHKTNWNITVLLMGKSPCLMENHWLTIENHHAING